MSNQTIQINAYSFHEALEKIQPYLKDNFTFDFVSNENYPRSFGTQFVFAVLEQEPVAPQPVLEAVTKQEDTQTSIRIKGRPKKEPE